MKSRRFPLIRWLTLSAAALAGLVVLGAGALWFMLQPVNSRSEENVTIVVPQGSSSTAIGELLAEKGLIRSTAAFRFIVWKDGLRGRLQAGTFDLNRSLSTPEIAQALTKGTSDIWITIPEGLRAEEIGELLAQKLDGFSLEDESYQTECLAYEGFLFPETYLVPRLYSTTQMCRLLRQEYGRQVPMDLRESIHQAGHTEEDVITLASIVQREAKRPEDMKVVAGILWNRLAIGMPLQVDATLQYVRGYDENEKTWWPVPRSQDKDLDSPYNTYQHPGLPPKPITNPGIDAIRAAIFPTETDNLYYISNTDGSRMYFAETFEQHRQNIERYLQ